ncbi:hypothetical protein [Allorhodopirellula solitaria]|uniref:Uncharacterized protein n=1 Tax=Allorhodopirellula solitaria TaxID=2527987 RepID=A0A5C5WQ41_9BACT|nr:hypothetical protein [Allorhodopirellula solitaria]TWT52375.1 hypothetical protein CA85_50290 [Allorhodopirellula solitaria]
MTSPADSGKSTSSSSARRDTPSPRSGAARASAKGASPRKKSAAGKQASQDSKAARSKAAGSKATGAKAAGSKTPGRSAASRTKTVRPKKKNAAAKPAGPTVYASDVVAGVARADTGSRGSSVLPSSMDQPVAEALQLSPIEPDLPMEHRPAQVLRQAEEAFAMTGSWVVFYRTMIAPGGVVDQLYESPEARRYFETTSEFAELLEMVTAIRSQDDSGSTSQEPPRVITVRMPRSLHAATIREANELELTINAYCLTKLLQPANPRFTPLELGKRRGRRPGPQIAIQQVKVKSKSKSKSKSKAGTKSRSTKS